MLNECNAVILDSGVNDCHSENLSHSDTSDPRNFSPALKCKANSGLMCVQDPRLGVSINSVQV